MPRPDSVVKEILASISAGLVVGVTATFLQASFAALIFAGQLSEYLSQGTGILLLGALIMGITVTLTSSYAGSIAMPQDSTSAIMAVVAAAIVSSMAMSTPSQTFATVVAAMIFSTMCTGLFLTILGKFNLGRLVRYMPFPVVGGFLAGTGWLLSTGGISVMADGLPGLELLDNHMLVRWVPGFLFAVMLLLLTRWYSHFLIMPLMLAAGIAVFYVFYFFINGDIQSAQANDWLLGPFPKGGLAYIPTMSALQHADWTVVFSNIVNLATIAIIAPISLLLNTSGLEISSRSDIEPNRELNTVGVANIAAGLAGSPVGYHFLSLSTLGPRLGVTSRMTGLVSIAVIASVLLFSADLLAIFPKMIAGASLLFLGLAFLTEWLYDAWFKLSRVDYLLVWLILITIIMFGMLPGVIVGTLISALVFIYSYATTNAIRHTLSRKNFQSYVMRPPAHENILQQQGSSLAIFKLQGFLFFGTAHKLTEQVKQKLQSNSQKDSRNNSRNNIQFLLLDFRLVTGIDSSASLSFLRLKQVTDKANVVLIFTNVSTADQHQLRDGILDSDSEPRTLLFNDLDQGVAWAEEQLISFAENTTDEINAAEQTDSFTEYFENALTQSNSTAPSGKLPMDRMLTFMEKIQVPAGAVFLKEGDPVERIYFIEAGRIVIYTEHPDGHKQQLRVQQKGTVIGEIGIYSGQRATATAAAEVPATLYALSKSNFHLMEIQDPELAIATHRLIANVMGRKLTQANYAIVALQK